jgi:hypothetical protein
MANTLVFVLSPIPDDRDRFGVDGGRLVRVAVNSTAVRDAVRLGHSAVHLACQGVGHHRRLQGPGGVAEGRAGEGAEVAPVVALGLDTGSCP